MLFVNNEEVNLFDYLRERRVKKPVCEGCPHAIFCGGFYELENVPEPTWLIQPEDLVRITVSVDGKTYISSWMESEFAFGSIGLRTYHTDVTYGPVTVTCN
jgi:hypothetical protein